MAQEMRTVQSSNGLVPRLGASNLSKSYGHVQGLRGMSAEFMPGLTGIIGDNGAGKSTLMRILSGAEIPDGGWVLVDGQPQDFDSALDARAQGIESLYQDLALVDTMSIADNIFLGRERTRRFAGIQMVNRRRMYSEADEAIKAVRIAMPPSRVGVKQLSGGQRQAVAIARAIYFDARVVLLDEPTAALGPRETAAFMRIIRDLADSKVTVVMVGHNLPQMLELADSLLVMRAGQVVARLDPGTTSLRDITELMVGSS